MTYGFALLFVGSLAFLSGVRNQPILNVLRGITAPQPGGPGEAGFTARILHGVGSGLGVGDPHRFASAPASGKLTELFHEDAGTSNEHVHVASCDRGLLIRLARIGRGQFGLSIREFPPFDHVDCVHVDGSWHYRDSRSCNTPRNCANRGDGLAFDASGGRAPAFYSWLAAEYGTPA